MLRKVASGVAWVGRGASVVLGLAFVLALVFGALSVAAAHAGSAGLFHLGHNNPVGALSTMTGNLAGAVLRVDNNGTGAALQLEAGAARPPLTVNATAGKATNLNADRLDGKDATQIGVNGLQRITAFSNSDSASPKGAIAECPAGKVLIGTGYDVFGAQVGNLPDATTEVVVTRIFPTSTFVEVIAFEDEPKSTSWSLAAYAICANAP